MSIKLRKRENNDGSTTLLLDIYHNGKRHYEFLTNLKLHKANNPIARQENKERLAEADKIRNKREQELQLAEYGLTPNFKSKVDFVELFETYLSRYNKKDKRVLQACLAKFKSFLAEEGIKSLNTKQLTEGIASDFKEYLESNLKGETPANYFKKFKKVLSYGVREKLLSINPAQELKAKRNEGIKKEILSFDEIKQLASAPCGNEEVKLGFLLSCISGLRFCDITVLQWQHISSNVLKITQQKTGRPVTIILNDTAMEILNRQPKKNQFVFNLPSHTACLKNIRTWCKTAQIQKKITWHCARHSFATNIILYGSDVHTASTLLGHSSLAFTQRYLRQADSLREKAVENLPQFQIS